MKASDILLNKIVEFEGLKLKAYKCPSGVWTIGVGHTLNVKQGQVITKDKAMQFLREDLARFENVVNKLGVCKTQGQFDALVDFAFNAGGANLLSSTLLKKIKAGAPRAEIEHEFSRWVYAKGVKLNGLVKRRSWEAMRYFQ